MKIIRGARPRTAATSAALTCAIVRHPSFNVRPVVAPTSGATVRKTAHNNRPAIARSGLPSGRPSSSNRAASARREGRRRAAIAQMACQRVASSTRPAAQLRMATMREGGAQRPAAMRDKRACNRADLSAQAKRRAPPHTPAAGGQPALEGLTRSAWTDSPRKIGRNNFRRTAVAVATATSGGGGGVRRGREAAPFALGCLHALNEFVITQVLLAEPLGSLAFKMVQVQQMRSERM
ncbi:hypothetical protein F511_24641 [Dorcoceras hygrometricum]|uniref:Uncharacterized protein n=1 Tax=Dorcoceras hygrometricum TaxID=472368 RepID=A0A2Z7DAQ7_9LAMI|nr:hypothetical protein F511_24641 [Dorcoceras hygrometricum]